MSRCLAASFLYSDWNITKETRLSMRQSHSLWRRVCDELHFPSRSETGGVTSARLLSVRQRQSVSQGESSSQHHIKYNLRRLTERNKWSAALRLCVFSSFQVRNAILSLRRVSFVLARAKLTSRLDNSVRFIIVVKTRFVIEFNRHIYLV